MIQVFAYVVCEKPQHKILILLEQSVLPSVMPISLCVRKMLRTVQFDDQSRLGVAQVDLHTPIPIKWDRQIYVQPKTAACFRQCFQAAIEESFARTASTANAPGVRRWRPGSVEK